MRGFKVNSLSSSLATATPCQHCDRVYFEQYYHLSIIIAIIPVLDNLLLLAFRTSHTRSNQDVVLKACSEHTAPVCEVIHAVCSVLAVFQSHLLEHNQGCRSSTIASRSTTAAISSSDCQYSSAYSYQSRSINHKCRPRNPLWLQVCPREPEGESCRRRLFVGSFKVW